MSANEKPTADQPKPTSHIQGEGDYEAARRFREETEHFLESADVADLARKAAPKSKQEALDLKQAEQIGRSHRADAKK
jgi:hypothetical protein